MKLPRHSTRFNHNQQTHRSLPRIAVAAEQQVVEISHNIHRISQYSRANGQKMQAVDDASQALLRRTRELEGLSQTFG